MLANSMQNCLGFFYSTLLINFHRQTQGDNKVSRSTVNLSFRRLLKKITKNQKIKQGTNIEGKRCDQCDMNIPSAMLFKNRQKNKCDKAIERRLSHRYVEMVARHR